MRTEEFFGFLKKRESVRLLKESGHPWPWTDDKILQDYKFTNVRREHDATSRQLIKIYREHADDDPKDILLNCAVNRYFGRHEFAVSLGWLRYDGFDVYELEEHASERRASGEPVFTGAYVITNGGVAAPKEEVVCHYYISGLYAEIPNLVEHAQMTRSWREVATLMSKLQGFGGSGFMTKETLCDTTYTGFWGDRVNDEERPSILSLPDDWYSWSPCGPGARRGAARVLGQDDIQSVEAQSIRKDVKLCAHVMQSLSDLSTKELGFRLAPHDIQFGLCEFDKYERVRLGQGRPKSKYKR